MNVLYMLEFNVDKIKMHQVKARVNEDACRCENNYDELVIDALVESLLEQKRSSL